MLRFFFGYVALLFCSALLLAILVSPFVAFAAIIEVTVLTIDLFRILLLHLHL